MSTNEYTPTIGLEIHAELKTETKMFCNSPNDPDETEPNVNVCPICLGHPGTLPVINREAVKHVLTIGAALDGELAEFTEFDRKNYFYPDIPKGYQISQYQHPLVEGGTLNGVEVTRIHLEEDTAKSTHIEEGNYSLVDFNRAGLPLMELVTEPDITSGDEAANFARELQLLLRYLNAGEANMEKGEMRIEANVSVSKTDDMGTKVEVKNINSFRAVQRAVEYEIDRQIQRIESGEEIAQETRGWDEDSQKTFSQRAKETSEDYRYFPDPDLPKLDLSEIEEFNESVLKDALPEMPWERRDRYRGSSDLSDDDIDTFVQNSNVGDFFDAVVSYFDESGMHQTAANYITSDLLGMMNGVDKISIKPKHFAELITMIENDTVSSRGAKDTLEIMYADGGSPRQIAEDNDLLQQSSEDDLLPVVEEIIEENDGVVEDYKGGKESALQYLVGQGMQKTQGSANPEVLAELLKEKMG